MKVLIVDYSISILETAGEMLFGTGNISCLHKAISYTEAIDVYRKICPNFVMLEPCRGSSNSSKISKEIKRHSLKKYIIVLAVADVDGLQDTSHSHGIYFFFDNYSDFEKMSRKIALPANQLLNINP